MNGQVGRPGPARGSGNGQANPRRSGRRIHNNRPSSNIAPGPVTSPREIRLTVVDDGPRPRRRTGQLPCSVPGCPETFTRSYDVRRHIRTVHQDIREQCQYCSYRCREDHMRDHLRVCAETPVQETTVQEILADVASPIYFHDPAGELRVFLSYAELMCFR